MTGDLWHFTCQHSHDTIGAEGHLLPGNQLTTKVTPWPGRFVWLTDLDTPIRDALGLTNHLVTCDRTAYRYRATDTTTCHPWVQVARHLPANVRAELEAADGARPMHWFVSIGPVPVVLA